jgi:hypothetical protein
LALLQIGAGVSYRDWTLIDGRISEAGDGLLLGGQIQILRNDRYGCKPAVELHDRMPVILEPDQFEAWLTGAADVR